MDFTVIIPAYKPDDSLLRIVQQLFELENRIIVVDDGSGPDFRPVFDSIAASNQATVLHHRTNRGKGSAIRTALEYIHSSLPDCSTLVSRPRSSA